jgi:hypothetical protein
MNCGGGNLVLENNIKDTDISVGKKIVVKPG